MSDPRSGIKTTLYAVTFLKGLMGSACGGAMSFRGRRSLYQRNQQAQSQEVTKENHEKTDCFVLYHA